MHQTRAKDSESQVSIPVRRSPAQSSPTEHEGEHPGSSLRWRELSRVFFVSAAAGALWFLRGTSSPYIIALGVVCTLVGGFPIFREAFENIAQRRMTMELSMSIAIVAALAIREVFTALVITLFVLVAEILESLTVGRGRRAIERLIELLPSTATVRRADEWMDVEIQEIAVGDVVLVRPGGRIPVDGSVVGGRSFVDQAPITGESMPVEKRPGTNVFAGTINQSGALEVRVERLGRDTTFGQIIEAVERAEASRAPIQGIADRLAGYLVYVALAAAAVTFFFTHNMRSTISVIIVAGACGIAAGTPLAILGAIGRAARNGVIIKGGLYLEKLAEADIVLLDKTGTLTYGTPEIKDLRPAEGVSAETLLETAAIAECQSEHPVAKAILSRASEMKMTLRHPERFEYTPGRGVVAEIDGEEITVGKWKRAQSDGRNGAESATDDSDGAVFVTRGGHLLGSIQVADRLRPEARAAIENLHAMGLRAILLTGDSRRVAEEVASWLGVDEFFAELLPEQKLQHIEGLLAQGHTVVMVGDGINDAPALTRATVGVAMGSGTDVARESSDIVLIGSDLINFAETVRVARWCRRIIMQNFAGPLIVDSIGVGLAAFGFLNPLLAAFIHVSSEMIFILNSATLLPPVSSAKKPVRGVLPHSAAAAN